MGRPPQVRSGGWRSRPAALALALLAGSFAVAERADAQASAPTGQVWGAVPVAAGQVAQQASQTAQNAGAQATTVQVQPTNIVAPVTVQSPRAATAVAQGNTAAAGAGAANSSSTTQGANQSKGGGAAPASPGTGTAAGPAPAPASGGPSQASGQASQTGQNAGAQATTVQVAPVNIAIPITIGSPGSSIVIVQTNAASSGANAGNSSSTTQTSGQAATGSPGALPGQPGTAAPGASPPAAVPTGLGGTGSVLPPTSSGAPWIWNWNWVWNWTIEINLPSVQLPGFPRWALPGGEPGTTAPARPERAAPVPTRHVAAPAARNADGAGLDTAAVPPDAGQGVSSSIVQRPIASSDRTLESFVALPLPPQPALSGGAGFVPAGLLVGGLALLALYLGSLGLLFGRLSLASAPLRHQAYLAPLQRPG